MGTLVANSDLREMYNNIGYTCDLSTNSLKEKAKKVGKIVIAIFFLLGAFFAHLFSHSNKISDSYAKWFLPLLETDGLVPAREKLTATAPMSESQRYTEPPSEEPVQKYSDEPPPHYDSISPQVIVNPQAVRMKLEAVEAWARERYRAEGPSQPTTPSDSRKNPEVWDSHRLKIARGQQGNPYFRMDPPSEGRVFIPPGHEMSRPLNISEKEKRRLENENRYVQREFTHAITEFNYASKKTLRALKGKERKLELLLQTPIPEVAKPQPPRATPPDVAIDIGWPPGTWRSIENRSPVSQ